MLQLPIIEWNIQSNPKEDDSFMFRDLPHDERMEVIGNLVIHYLQLTASMD